ncbi:MAG: putative metal-binding motif-containing protein [Saprospiraceae bacterium]|nr:putative metal-binding motif-containing protein [Saprospiraceae bacterium]
MVASIPAGQFRFTDLMIPTSGNLSYMVRAEKKEKNKSGSYFNKSIGVATSIVVPFVDRVGDGVDGFADCDDTNANISPLQFKFDLTKDYPEYAIVIRDKHNCSRLSDVENGVMTLNCKYFDGDSDGFFDYQDCDDTNASVNPNQSEIPFNLIDDDCDKNTLDSDGDFDGYSITEDCNDNNPNINPSARNL